MKGIIGICLMLLIFLPVACKGINDAPEEEQTIRFELADLKQQVGVGENQNQNRSEVPGDSASTNAVQSIIVGALVTDRSTPYSSDLALTPTVLSSIETELTQSAQYFKITHLPTSENFVEFQIPPTSAGKWQIVAFAVSDQPATLGELKNSQMSGTALYMGFNETLYSGNDGVGQAIEINMKRACLVDSPPKGCATYDEHKNGVVTAAVEIIDIKINGQSTTMGDFPMVVRENPSTANPREINGQDAAGVLRVLAFSEATVTSLLVRTTHASNPVETSLCQALASKADVTVTELETACQVQDYKISY